MIVLPFMGVHRPVIYMQHLLHLLIHVLSHIGCKLFSNSMMFVLSPFPSKILEFFLPRVSLVTACSASYPRPGPDLTPRHLLG